MRTTPKTRYRFSPSDQRWQFWDGMGWSESKPLRGLNEDTGARTARALGVVVAFEGEELVRRFS